MSKKRNKRLQVLSAAIGCVFLLVLAGQAVFRIASGDFVGGKNYLGQPVGPVLQLIGVVVCLIVIGATAWRHWRGAPERENQKKLRQSEWMRQPPYKFPWE